MSDLIGPPIHLDEAPDLEPTRRTEEVDRTHLFHEALAMGAFVVGTLILTSTEMGSRLQQGFHNLINGGR